MRSETPLPNVRRFFTKAALTSVLVVGLGFSAACGGDLGPKNEQPRETAQQTPTETTSYKGTPTVPETTSASPSAPETTSASPTSASPTSASPASSSAISTESAAKQESATTNPKNTTESDDQPSVKTTLATTNGELKIAVKGLQGGPFTKVSCYSMDDVISITAEDSSHQVQGLGIVVNTKSRKLESLGVTTIRGFALAADQEDTKVTIAGNDITITGTGAGVDEGGKAFTSRKFEVDVKCK